MKKLFISCPMKGRTEENIKRSMEKMHKIAEIVFDQEVEVIPSCIEEDPPQTNDKRLWYLGKSIQMMAEADYFIGLRWTDFYDGCAVETITAERYEIPCAYVDMERIMPDAVEKEREWREGGA